MPFGVIRGSRPVSHKVVQEYGSGAVLLCYRRQAVRVLNCFHWIEHLTIVALTRHTGFKGST